MGILSGPVFGMQQIVEIVLPMLAGAVIVIGCIVFWFALTLVAK